VFGICAALLVACGGAAAYAIASPAHAARPADPLPTRVSSVQTVGLVAQPGRTLRLLGRAASGLRWGTMPPASDVQGDPQWTADTMAGGTYVFIYVPDGRCLASVPERHHKDLLALRQCNLGASQRWELVGGLTQSAGHSAGQYRDLASGRCLTAPGQGQATAAVLAPCARSKPGGQLISFWWGA
jgi:hypothetical protein